MNLTINVSGATMDDLTNIFYRLGEPGFKEVWESEKVEQLQQYINQGLSLSEALDRLDTDIHRKIEELEKQDDVEDRTEPVTVLPQQEIPVETEIDPSLVYTPPTIDPAYTEIPRIQQAQPVNELHLDSAPETPVVPNPQPKVSLDDKLKQVATALVEKQGSKRLTELLEPYGARSLMDLNMMHKEEFLNQLQRELAK